MGPVRSRGLHTPWTPLWTELHVSFKSSVECGDHSFGKELLDPPLGQGDSGLGVTGGMCPDRLGDMGLQETAPSVYRPLPGPGGSV